MDRKDNRIDFDQTGIFFDEQMFVIGQDTFTEGWKLWQLDSAGTATLFATTTTAFSDLLFGQDGALYIAEYSTLGDVVTISRVVPEPATLLLLGLGVVILRSKR